MLNNFIGGGQIFLHRVRMFMQVLDRSATISLALGIVIAILVCYPKLNNYDLRAAFSYQKAKMSVSFHEAINSFKSDVSSDSSTQTSSNKSSSNTNRKYGIQKKQLNGKYNNNNHNGPKIDAYTKYGLYAAGIPAKVVLANSKFKSSYNEVIGFLWIFFKLACYSVGGVFALIFALWAKFGAGAKENKHLEGILIKSVREVRNYLNSKNKASPILIDGMPLVKGSETSHILVSGMTGSGKTNLINKILPQVRKLSYPAIVIDQTGEMIARYYNEKRGDIIFNPLDSRSKSWDFFADCNSGYNHLNINEDLENFAKVLFSSRKNSSPGDPFWENSAETIFISCVEHLISTNDLSVKALKKLLNNTSLEELRSKLANTKASRYLESAKNTASSILSVMTTSCKPLSYIFESDNKFSVKEYFSGVKAGKDAWLFLSTPPSQRELIMPLLASITQLAVSNLMNIGIDEKRRMFFVTDELPALGRLPSLPTLMTESRKYGACVLAGLQSYNQLLDNYGQHMGSTIFGQFATKFIFRCNEPNLAKLMSEMFGSIEILKQQKSTSYGAHEHRDGISYSEQERKKQLIPANKFMELATLECYVCLPEPEIKVANIKLKPVIDVPMINQGFMPLEKNQEVIEVTEDNIGSIIVTQEELQILPEVKSNKDIETKNRLVKKAKKIVSQNKEEYKSEKETLEAEELDKAL